MTVSYRNVQVRVTRVCHGRNGRHGREGAGTRRKSVCAKSAHCTLFAVRRSRLARRSPTSPRVPELHHHSLVAVWRSGGGNTKSGGLRKCPTLKFPPAPRRATISTSPRPRIVRASPSKRFIIGLALADSDRAKASVTSDARS